MKGILIVGKAGSGKSTVANMLIKSRGFRKYSMAKWLKEVVMKHYDLGTINKKISIGDKSMRTILQEVGMKMREVDPNWHIDEVLKELPDDFFVIDDVRFVNEAETLKSNRECIIIKIIADEKLRIQKLTERDGYIPTKNELNDPSESEIDNIQADYEIYNQTYNKFDLLSQVYKTLYIEGFKNDRI